MEQGWVYMLLNSSTPGLAKVGRTTRPPADRAAELSASTGVATPFVVAFDQFFVDCAEAERRVHAELDRRGLRVAPNREFFRGTPSDIIRVIIETADACGAQPVAGPDLSADRLLQAGENALYGLGESLQDTGEALRCFRLAATRGSLKAHERAGHIYTRLYIKARDRAGRRRALNTLKEGVRRGNYYCYCEMAALFAAERHVANFLKSWDLFFARRTDAFREELEDAPERFASACGQYIALALELGQTPGHHADMSVAADDIMKSMLAELDAVRGHPPARMRVTSAMRWAYQTLLPQPTPTPPKPRWRPGFPRWGTHPDTAAA